MDFVFFFLVFTIFWIVLWLMSVLVKIFGKPSCEIPIRDASKGHHWVYVEAFDPGHYCNVCEISTFHGAQCDFCGIIVDDGCIGKANAAISCKSLATVAGSMKHHWVNGNLPHHSVCGVCEELCGSGPGLQDFKCCWCQTSVHKECMESFTSICDLGKWKRMIVPPNCVRLKKVGWKGRRHFVVKEVVRPDIANWSPLIVVANRKSGNGEGDVVLQSYRRLLNPAQVLDLAEIQPETGLEWCRLIPDVPCRVLVAGGDGSMGWIMSAVENLNLDPYPKVALLPLGTGNDLSRVLGYGSGHVGPIDAGSILDGLSSAKPVLLDRWNVDVNYLPRFGIRRPKKSFRMSNYLSVGVDALVTLNFHNRRHTLPRVMSGRFMNKFLFFTYGTKDVLDRACKNLYKRVELYMDGERKEMPELEGIVILNIETWGAGVRPWRLGHSPQDPEIPKQFFDDGLIEVLGLYSSFHIAQLQVGLSEPYRFGQAKEVTLKIKGGKSNAPALPMQVDGEPWLQGAANITVKLRGKAQILASQNYESSSNASLDNLENRGFYVG